MGKPIFNKYYITLFGVLAVFLISGFSELFRADFWSDPGYSKLFRFSLFYMSILFLQLVCIFTFFSLEAGNGLLKNYKSSDFALPILVCSVLSMSLQFVDRANSEKESLQKANYKITFEGVGGIGVLNCREKYTEYAEGEHDNDTVNITCGKQ